MTESTSVAGTPARSITALATLMPMSVGEMAPNAPQ